MTGATLARWRDRAQPTVDLYVDGRLPGYGRTLFVLMGDTLTDRAAALGVKPGFNIAMLESPPGKGAAPHIHKTLEVLMPVTGRWRFEAGGHAVELGPLDVLVIPTHLYRSFRNVSGDTAKLFALVAGRDMVNTIAMHPDVVAAARGAGLDVDDVGRQRLPGFEPQAVHITERPTSPEEVARGAVRFETFADSSGYLHVLGPRDSRARVEGDVSFSLGFVRGGRYEPDRASSLEVLVPLSEAWRLEEPGGATLLEPFDTVLAADGTFVNPDPHALLLTLREHHPKEDV